ncbi:MAG: DoxX family protein [Chloroflexi bacterium]|nr:MAG: DoxX family protein [Chloroflexota bacterium]
MALADSTLLMLRLVVGLTFAAHGAQKAFGWWGGPGFEGWQKIVAGMRFQPAPLFTVASVGAELIGGLLLAVGLFTPLAATALIGQSVVIILKVHLPNGFWNKAGGVEFALSLAAGVLAILGIGPGGFSLDHLIGFGVAEPVVWVLLGIGLLGGLAAYGVSRVAAAPQTAPQQR